MWVPAPVASAAHTIPDGEVVARIGAMLFMRSPGKIAAYRFESERALRTTLRSVRPDCRATSWTLLPRADNKPQLRYAA